MFQPKPLLKIRTASTIFWIYLGMYRDYSLKNIFKQMLKVSAFYIEKQKRFILKKNTFQAVVSKYAKIDPKDGACCPNFQ